jgi:hypothetical protein
MNKKDFIEGIHFYLEGGLVVFTELYLKRRGYCCKKNCRHCPYKNLTNGSIEETIHDAKSGETHDELRQGCPHSRIEDDPTE